MSTLIHWRISKDQDILIKTEESGEVEISQICMQSPRQSRTVDIKSEFCTCV
jgi:hypothetical protein